MKWIMWGIKIEDIFYDIGSKEYAKAHLIRNRKIVKVSVEESDNGTYHGWIKTGDDFPEMIWHSLIGFNMCFPYGFEHEEKVGHGHHVLLKIEEV